VINTNLPPILHRFGDTAFQSEKSLYFATALACKLPRLRGSLGTISVKFFVDVNGWPWTKRLRKIAENFNRLSRVH